MAAFRVSLSSNPRQTGKTTSNNDASIQQGGLPKKYKQWMFHDSVSKDIYIIRSEASKEPFLLFNIFIEKGKIFSNCYY